MKKFFSFSHTISGKTFFLRIIFGIVLSIPFLIAVIAKWTTYFMSLGNFDLTDSSFENQMEIQQFGDELSLKISENPEFYLNDFIQSFSFGWVFLLVFSLLPTIWFVLATYYKRISAIFYDQRKSVFFALLLFDVVTDYVVFNTSGVISTIVTLISFIIFALLVFYDSKLANHKG